MLVKLSTESRKLGLKHVICHDSLLPETSLSKDENDHYAIHYTQCCLELAFKLGTKLLILTEFKCSEINIVQPRNVR